MKKQFYFNITFLIVLLISSINIYGQAKVKKPTIMVVPSDNWCVQNGFTQTYNNQGLEVVIPDYKKALQNDPILLQAISLINGMMAERGFPLKDLESSIKSLESEAADTEARMSKSGGEVMLNPTDQLKMKAKADIWMQLTYTVNKVGPKKSISFNLRGLDAYTNKQVATAVGNGAPSMSASIPVLVQEAVLAHIDNFNVTLMSHFDDLFENGREVIMKIRVWDDWGEDLESEFGDDEIELMEIIEDWVDENVMVSGAYNLVDATENMMNFEQMRIPLIYTDSKGREKSYDVRRFGKELRKYLKQFDIESKLESDGLGKVNLWMGGK